MVSDRTATERSEYFEWGQQPTSFLTRNTCYIFSYRFHAQQNFEAFEAFSDKALNSEIIICLSPNAYKPGHVLYTHMPYMCKHLSAPVGPLYCIIDLCRSSSSNELSCSIAMQITVDPQHMKHEDFVKHFTTEETKYIRHLDMLIKVCMTLCIT